MVRAAGAHRSTLAEFGRFGRRVLRHRFGAGVVAIETVEGGQSVHVRSSGGRNTVGLRLVLILIGLLLAARILRIFLGAFSLRVVLVLRCAFFRVAAFAVR